MVLRRLLFALVACLLCAAPVCVSAGEVAFPPVVDAEWQPDVVDSVEDLATGLQPAVATASIVAPEPLLWWTSGARTSPLLATGTIGSPGSEVLFGDQPINTGLRTGIRVRAGHWFDCDQTRGWEGSFLWLGNDGNGAAAGSADGSATVIRPFIDAGTGKPGGEFVSSPGAVAGFSTVSTGSNLFGADLLRRCNLCSDCFDDWDSCDCSRTFIRRDLLVGFRYLNYSDRLAINEDLALI